MVEDLRTSRTREPRLVITRLEPGIGRAGCAPIFATTDLSGPTGSNLTAIGLDAGRSLHLRGILTDWLRFRTRRAPAPAVRYDKVLAPCTSWNGYSSPI